MPILRSILLTTVFSTSQIVACVQPRPIAPSTRSGEMTPPTAAVQAQVAEFSIPVANTRKWRWARRETADNTLEYRWEVGVTSGAESYRFGFSLFKFPGKKEGAGSLRHLLKAGQASVWRMERTGGGLVVREARVSVSAVPARVIVRVTDTATMRLLFRHRPPTAIVVTRTPDTDEVSREVPISYAE